MSNKIRSSLFGFIVGDAMGVPTEFLIREKLQQNKVTEMIADTDNFCVPKGSWSDDTSMTIATIDSIINVKGIDYNDIMNNYLEWSNNSKYTPTDKVFDVGRTCLRAIVKYHNGNIDPIECGLKDIVSNGNGSLMRILPIVIYCYYKHYEDDDSYKLIKDISSLTHAHEISIMACFIYYLYIKNLLNNLNKEEAYIKIQEYDYNKYFSIDTINVYERILKNKINNYNLDEISSKGYVVDTLEAVLWCFLNEDNYRDVIITAINLGNDTDTIAAITGALAGLYYDNIPTEWINQLQKKDYLEDIINKFIETIN